jgi:hypothetical protein
MWLSTKNRRRLFLNLWRFLKYRRSLAVLSPSGGNIQQEKAAVSISNSSVPCIFASNYIKLQTTSLRGMKVSPCVICHPSAVQYVVWTELDFRKITFQVNGLISICYSAYLKLIIEILPRVVISNELSSKSCHVNFQFDIKKSNNNPVSDCSW